jgi:N-acetylneuraminate lyase|eukprot:COSAG06_NODE_4338_length_4356_cov_1.937280_1_plen_368_part_00
MPASARRTVLRSVASHLAATPAAEKSVESPVLAKLGAVERYKYVTGKEPLIQGLWPAFITPLTADGEVDVAAVKPLCDYLIDECGVHGLYACGGTGEMRSLDPEARKTMCAATCEAVAGRVPVVVCVGETVDTAEAVDLASHAKSVGADGLSSTVPVWAVGDPNLLELTVDLYTALGEVGLPLYAYWIADTKGDWGSQDYLDAMKDVPNFAGLKFTDYTFNIFQNLMSRSGYSLNVVSGPDEMMLAGKAAGAHGAIGTTYNVMPKMNVAMHNLFMAGDMNGATDIMFKCNRMIEILTGGAAEFKHDGSQTLAACKAVMRELQGLPAVRDVPCQPPVPPRSVRRRSIASHSCTRLLCLKGWLAGWLAG